MSLKRTYDYIEARRDGSIGWIALARPAARNALCRALIDDLNHALDVFEADPEIRCVVLTGSEKVFAAGADIREMAGKTFSDLYQDDFLEPWQRLAKFRKPVIAAVAGAALGGGCELVLMCDVVIAAENANFGQPEVNLGLMPGAGGTQRLLRAVGKAKAMEMCLTGRVISAEEAERCGWIVRVVPLDALLDTAREVAREIAAQSLPALMMIKESVLYAQEASLSAGARFERRLFQAMFSLRDAQEGMAAFLEKRSPEFKNS